MGQSQKNKKELLLGPRKLTPAQIDAMPNQEAIDYLGEMSAEESGQYFMEGIIENLNDPENHGKSR